LGGQGVVVDTREPVDKVAPYAATPDLVPEEDVAMATAPAVLVAALAARARRTYVSTEAVLPPGRVRFPPDFEELRAALAALRPRQPGGGGGPDPPTDAARDLRALNPEDVRALVATAIPDGVTAAEAAALRRLFDLTTLPTHADLALLYPWLDVAPTVPPPRRLSAAELRAPMAATADEALVSPAPWVYMYSNPLVPMGEVLTAEYIAALAAYVTHRLRAWLDDSTIAGKVTVLEVGAGTGRLTWHLRHQVLAQLPPAAAARVRLLASDVQGSTATVAAGLRGPVPVVRATAAAAIQRYRPTLVLAAWMSKDEDWTPAFRAAPSVREYVLMGERDYGVSGTPHGTWGIAPRGTPADKAQPAWVREGFVRMDLERLSLLQVCRTDSPAVRFHCKTVVFRRTLSPAASGTVYTDEL
jgi:hypothetical protein